MTSKTSQLYEIISVICAVNKKSIFAITEPPDPSVTPVSCEDLTSSTPATPNGINSTANSTASFSEDSRDSSVSLTYTPTPRRGRGRGRIGRGSWRGRGAYSKIDPETKRLNKLKEVRFHFCFLLKTLIDADSLCGDAFVSVLLMLNVYSSCCE